MVAARLRQPDLDAQGRIGGDELAVGRPLDDVADGLQKIAPRMRWHSVEQRDDEFSSISVVTITRVG